MNENINEFKDEINDLKEQLKTLRREKSNLQMAVNLINQISRVAGVENIVDHILQILISAVGGSNISIYYTVDGRWRYEDVLGKKQWLDSIEDDIVRKSIEQKIFLKRKEKEESKLTIPGFPRTYETWVYPLQFQGFFFGALRMQGMAIEHAHYRENIDPFITYSTLILYNEVTSLKKLQSAYNKVSNAREDLQKSKDQFELAMKFANEGLFDWNLQTNEIYYSPVWKSIIGYDDNEIKNEFSEWERLTKPEDIKASWAMLNEVLEGRRNRFEKEFQMKHKEGHWVNILSRANVIFNEKGEGMRVVGTHVDITERKQLEESLRQAQKMESVGRLAGGVAHDFNNMLGVILGHIEMALDDVDPAAPLYASLQAVQHAAERSSALTRQLLAFARKQTIAPKVIDMNDTVVGMLNMLRRLIGEDIDLLWQPCINLRPVKVDPSQLDQLLANLCVNARDAIAGVGKITIETHAKTFDEDYCADHLEFQPGEYILLEVSDNGCGMDKKTLNHIFEPFFTTKEMGQGTGLGLASIYGIVKQNNGFINVYSEPGQGTTFKIYLPAYTMKSDGVMEKAPDLPTKRGNETILLVEDEPTILEMTTMMLERLGYTVVAAATPSEAIRLAHEYRGRLDLLMTDVVMPEMNGRQLAGNLLSHYPDLKRLFMSGYTADVIAHHGVLDAGVHFIQKPFSMKDLGRLLREALESRHVH